MSLPDILAEVARHGVPHVCVTGGEPLAQPACLPLLSKLSDAGYAVSLETSGALDISGVDVRVSRIVDLKAPGSGEFDRNRWQNLALLTANDELKLVLKDRADYEWARQLIVDASLLRSVRCSFHRSRESWRRRRWRTGYSPIGYRCAFSCNSTKCFGVRCGVDKKAGCGRNISAGMNH
jgi:organic radical activating enzyme